MSLLLDALKKAETAKRVKAADSPGAPETGEKPASGDAEFVLEMPAPPDAPPPEASANESDLAFPELSLGDMEPPPPEAIPAEPAAPAHQPQPQAEARMETVLSLDFPEPPPPPKPVASNPSARPEPIGLTQEQPIPSVPPPVAVIEEIPAPLETVRPQAEPALVTPPPAAAMSSQASAKNILAAKQDKPKRNFKLLGGMVGVAMLAGVAIAYYYWQALSQPGIAPVRPQATPAAPSQPLVAPPQAAPRSVDSQPPISLPPAPVEKVVEKLVTPAGTPADKPVKIAAPTPSETAPLPGTSLPSRDGGVKIFRDGDDTKLDPLLAGAYQAFMAGDNGKAENDYRKVLQQAPNNRDALLGLAAIAASRGQMQDAENQYLRALQLDPRDAAAQAGLIGLKGYSDPASSESRLKTLLSQNPDVAYLHFALGNIYAAQSRWPEAQEAYFDALHSDSSNADYAFNLAVSLEHLDQRKPALTYYQRALTLAKQRPAGFDSEQLKRRIHELQAN